MSSYLLCCCIYFDAWCITCCPKRGEILEVYRVIAYICYIYFDAWYIVWKDNFGTSRLHCHRSYEVFLKATYFPKMKRIAKVKCSAVVGRAGGRTGRTGTEVGAFW